MCFLASRKAWLLARPGEARCPRHSAASSPAEGASSTPAAAHARVSPRLRHGAQLASAPEDGQVPQRATRWLVLPVPRERGWSSWRRGGFGAPAAACREAVGEAAGSSQCRDGWARARTNPATCTPLRRLWGSEGWHREPVALANQQDAVVFQDQEEEGSLLDYQVSLFP